jgi:hypothetical protein
LITAIFLAFIVFHSTKTWIPILFILLAIRDINLGSIFGAGGIKIGDIFIVYIFSIWLFSNIFTHKSLKFIRSKLDFFIILFIVFYIISLLWSSDLELGFLRVSKFIRNFCFYILIRELLIENFRDSYKKVTFCFIITGISMGIVYIFVIMQGASLSDIGALFQKEVLSSTDLGFARKYETGGGILISGPSNWLALAASFTFGSIGLTKTKLMRSIQIFLIPIMVFMSTIITLSRSAMMMVSLIFAILLIGNYKIGLKENKRILIFIMLSFLIIGSVLGIQKIIFSRFAAPFEDSSWYQRVDLGEIAIKAFLYSPIIGIGPGSNFSWQSQYTDQVPSRLVDNLYLTILSEVGSIGFMIFMIIVFLWIKYLFYCFAYTKSDLYIRNISLVIFAFSISYLSIALIGQEFESFEAWIMLGITSAVRNIQTAGNIYSVRAKNL